MSDIDNGYFKEIFKNLKPRINQSELADSLNVSKGYISDILSNKKNLTDELIEKFEKIYNIKVDKFTKSSQTPQSTNQSLTLKNKVEIPYYNVDFSGGWKSENLFATHQPSFFITNPEFTRAEFACNLVGNSISRRIPHNAIIGLKEIKEWKVYFPTNEIYAVVMKNELRTVKIVKRSANKDFLTLIPDPLDIYNQTGYEPEEVPIDFIEKFFQVVAWGQFEKLAM